MNELKPGVGRAGFLAGGSTGESLYSSFEDIHISYFISWLLDHFLHLKGRKASLSWGLLTDSSHDYLEFTWMIQNALSRLRSAAQQPQFHMLINSPLPSSVAFIDARCWDVNSFGGHDSAHLVPLSSSGRMHYCSTEQHSRVSHTDGEEQTSEYILSGFVYMRLV